jgi:prepilin-type N-terminal cleavage/methylation domain-containing protein
MVSAVRRSRGFTQISTRESRGFTLIELLVVTAILVIVSGLVLANHSRFGGKILLQNLAYDMALSVRQAQVYGISVRQFGAGTYSAGYGIRFSTSVPTSYVLFADAVQIDGMFSNGESVQTYSLDRGYRVAKLCAPAGTNRSTCTSVPSLDILFKRPEPDAYISANGVPCVSWDGTQYQAIVGQCQESARIVLSAPSGDQVDFIVDLNGQVAVNKN